jgi:type IV secretory pathway VirB2 component (pilin)
VGRQVTGVLYALAMAAVIVGVDLAFFRNRFWERLMVNVGIVLVFAACQRVAKNGVTDVESTVMNERAISPESERA